MRGGHTTAITEGLPDLKVNALASTGGNELWVGTDGGVVRWDGKQLTKLGIPNALNGVQALTMTLDRDQNLWIGTNSRGLVRLNASGVAWMDGPQSRSSEAVTAVFEDREGNLWTANASGLERVRDSIFVTYSAAEGLPEDSAGPVYADTRSRTWFAPISGGLWWLRDGQRGHVTAAGLDHDVMYSIAASKDGLWIGRQHGGITHLRFQGESFLTETYTTADGLAQNSVYAVYESRDGSAWAGTLSGGVSRWHRGRITTYTSADGLASNSVASILEAADGTMWFATANGLSALANGQWRTYHAADGLPSGNINCLAEDSHGLLWIGTSSGLAFRQSGRIHAATAVPLLREQILGLAEDKNGSLWIATSTRVLRVKRDSLLRNAVPEGDIREYTRADGLRGLEGVKRYQSMVTDSSGRVWVSMNRGISVVDPARLVSSSAPAIVQVQTLLADGRPVSLHGTAHVPGGSQRITLSYSGLSLSVPERVRFRYCLDSFDRGWSDPVTAREAVYTNIPPGSYRFRVVASNPDGVWGSEEGVVAFEVEPLFWQTWWFRAGVLLACGMMAAALYRFRLHQLTHRMNLRFEERLAERTRIAQELHDTLLQGFLSASMQVHVASDLLPADSSAKPILARSLHLIRQVIEEGRNAVRGLRSSPNASLDLEHSLSRVQQECTSQGQPGTQAEFRVIVEGQPRLLQAVLRDEVYRIGREALLNALRHSEAKKIEVGIRYSANRLSMSVRDDGCGIDPQVLRLGRDGHWGLSGMRERADRIGARLRVFSGTTGTQVELLVPGHIAFQKQSRHGLQQLYERFQRKFRRREKP